MRLAEYLTRERKAVDEFAVEVGVDPASVRRYLRGERRPRGAVMQRIIEVTGGSVTPNDFWQLAPRKRRRKPKGETSPDCAAA
jgi:transcriptional regulator with XRE-family HTH domain